MIQKGRNRIGDIIILAVLTTLLVLRMHKGDESPTWISFINLSGLITSYFTLFTNIYITNGNKKCINSFTGVGVVILVGSVIYATIVLANSISFTSTVNDIITLFTLIMSLPNQLWVDLANKLLK